MPGHVTFAAQPIQATPKTFALLQMASESPDPKVKGQVTPYTPPGTRTADDNPSPHHKWSGRASCVCHIFCQYKHKLKRRLTDGLNCNRKG